MRQNSAAEYSGTHDDLFRTKQPNSRVTEIQETNANHFQALHKISTVKFIFIFINIKVEIPL